MAYRRKVLVQRTSEPNIVVRQIDLPNHPISHLNFTIILDMTATFQAYQLFNCLNAAFNELHVEQEGTTIITIRSLEMIWLSALYWGFTPWQTADSGDNLTARVGTSIQIPFGRRLYDPNECLPGKPFGLTQFRYDLGPLTANMTTRTIEIEAVELPNAQPTHHLIYKNIDLQNPSINFDNRYPLPRSNPILAIFLELGNQAVLAGSANPIERFRIEADGQDDTIILGDWYSIWHETRYRTAIRWLDQHDVIENVAAAYTQNATSRPARTIPATAGSQAGRHALIDFDPLKDGQHALDGTRRHTLDLIIDAGTADAQTAIPVELHKI